MKIGVGNDHRARKAKKDIIDMLRQTEHEIIDFGANDKLVDYADIACKVGFAVSCESVDRGILLGSMGGEMALVANKIEGIRAVPCYDEMQARLSREKLDCNILCLACELTSQSLIPKIVQKWLTTQPDQNDRHFRRISKIEVIEESLYKHKKVSEN